MLLGCKGNAGLSDCHHDTPRPTEGHGGSDDGKQEPEAVRLEYSAKMQIDPARKRQEIVWEGWRMREERP
jgi:hypothetical protein